MSITQGFRTFYMNLHHEPYCMIASGKKAIELRLFDEKRQQIDVGDVIIFTDTHTGECVKAKVLALHRFDSFQELYKSLPLLKCGYTEDDIDTASADDMNEYYSLEKQKKYGVVGIEICLLNE